MENLKELMKAEKRHQLVLGALFLVYIIFHINTPHSLALLIDNLYGTIVVVFLALTLFFAVNPVIAVLGLIAAIELLRRSKIMTGSSAMIDQMPTEDRKAFDMKAQNQFPMTLEEEIIQEQSTYAENLDLDTAAGFDTASLSDDILDFTERNPFGEVDF